MPDDRDGIDFQNTQSGAELAKKKEATMKTPKLGVINRSGVIRLNPPQSLMDLLAGLFTCFGSLKPTHRGSLTDLLAWQR